jgi:peptide/nickel transport system substrate-binding protein
LPSRISLRRCLGFLLILPLFVRSVEKGSLRIACFDFPGSFNPVYATGETAQAVANKIYQSLFYFDNRGNIRPELVDSFSCGEGSLEISLSLKKGARFADGSALGSRDVVATVALLKDPLFEYPYQSDLDFLEEIEATGPHDLRLRLRAPFAPWKNYLTFKVLCAGEIRRLGPEKFRRSVPRGSGPYRLATVNEPSGFELVNNPYWPHRQRFSRIRFTVLADPRQAPLLLLNREIDAVEIHGDDAKTYSRLPGWQKAFRLLEYRKFGFTYLACNLRRPRVNENLRRILYNRLLGTSFLDDFLQGAGARVFSPFLQLSAGLRPHPLPTVALAAPCKLKVMTNSESDLRRQLVLFICEELKGCGIELEPVFVEYRTFLQCLKRGNFDLAVSAFLLDMDWNMKDILSSSGYFNYPGCSDARMDAILEQGMREMDAERRRRLYVRAHDLWMETLPLIPLFSLNYYMGVSRRINVPDERFEIIGSSGDFFYNLQDW